MNWDWLIRRLPWRPLKTIAVMGRSLRLTIGNRTNVSVSVGFGGPHMRISAIARYGSAASWTVSTTNDIAKVVIGKRQAVRHRNISVRNTGDAVSNGGYANTGVVVGDISHSGANTGIHIGEPQASTLAEGVVTHDKPEFTYRDSQEPLLIVEVVVPDGTHVSIVHHI